MGQADLLLVQAVGDDQTVDHGEDDITSAAPQDGVEKHQKEFGLFEKTAFQQTARLQLLIHRPTLQQRPQDDYL